MQTMKMILHISMFSVWVGCTMFFVFFFPTKSELILFIVCFLSFTLPVSLRVFLSFKLSYPYPQRKKLLTVVFAVLSFIFVHFFFVPCFPTLIVIPGLFRKNEAYNFCIEKLHCTKTQIQGWKKYKKKWNGITTVDRMRLTQHRFTVIFKKRATNNNNNKKRKSIIKINAKTSRIQKNAKTLANNDRNVHRKRGNANNEDEWNNNMITAYLKLHENIIQKKQKNDIENELDVQRDWKAKKGATTKNYCNNRPTTTKTRKFILIFLPLTFLQFVFESFCCRFENRIAHPFNSMWIGEFSSISCFCYVKEAPISHVRSATDD